MANSDGQVRIDIITNASEASKQLNDVSKAFNKTGKSAENVTSVFNSLQNGVNKNIETLREMALGGGQNSKEFQRLAQQTREYKKALDEANASVQKATGISNENNNITNKLSGAVTKLAGAYLGIQGIRIAYQKVMEATEAFRTQERAVMSLNITLQNAGVYSQQYSQEIQKLASEIQSYSNYGDEAIIKAQALGQAYIGNTKITKELTRAVVDFAAATGMDLEQAFNLVGKSIGSSTNALGRYGIELKQGMSDSEKMTAITKQLGDRYDGQARQMANASVQLKNALGDLAEQLGGVFNPMVEATQKVLIKATRALTDWIAESRRAANSKDIKALETSLKYQQEQLKKATGEDKKLWEQRITQTQKYLEVQRGVFSQPANTTNKKATKYSDDFGFTPTSTRTSTNIQRTKDQYEKLQEAATKAKREIELAAIAHGTSSVEVQNAFTKYQQLNGQLQEISKLFDVEKQKTEEKKGSYQLLSERVSDLTQKLRDLATENQIGSTDWNTYKIELQSAQAELDNVNKSLENNGIKIENVSKSISSSISSGLVNALRNGGNAFDAFSSLATTALQKILDKLIEMSFVTPILNALTGGVGGSLFSFFGFKDGAAFKNGNVIPFAKGGVVNKPTIFPMANGGTGLMGEAGAEAVMPLRRMSNGRLGVEAENENGKAVNVNIYNQSGASVETRKRDDGSMDIFIRKVNEALSSERTSSGFRSAYAREDRKGVQAV